MSSILGLTDPGLERLGRAEKSPDFQAISASAYSKSYECFLSAMLIAIFPVTNETVFQTDLKFKDQDFLKLEVNTKLLPKEGTAVKLVIEVPKAK